MKKILIIAALKSEIGGLLQDRSCQLVSQWKKQSLFSLAGNRKMIYLGLTGVGKWNVRQFFNYFFKTRIKVDMIISTGYAGAIRMDLKVGQIILAEGIMDEIQKKYYRILVPPGYHNEFTILKGVCTPAVVFDKGKKILEKRYPGFSFVDMESGQVTDICRKNKIPLLIMRVISDGRNFKFPAMEFIRDSVKGINISSLIRGMINDPLTVGRIFLLRINLWKAKRSLSRALENIISGI